VPADCRVEFTAFGAARACAFDTGAPEFRKTRDALTAEWGREAAFIGSGGSIPVNLELQEKLGMDVINAGFGLADDRIHSPNEKYNLTSFHKGTRSWARILAALANEAAAPHPGAGLATAASASGPPAARLAQTPSRPTRTTSPRIPIQARLEELLEARTKPWYSRWSGRSGSPGASPAAAA
jgi:hypothetical protein